MKYFCKICQLYKERDKKKCCVDCGANLENASICPTTVIAGFKIIREIGRGSNGAVYLAEQTSLDRKVALKILPDVKAEDTNFVKDFLKEARAAARLNHPGIIQIYDAGVSNDGIYFLAMELIDGKSLEEIIQSKGALKVQNAVKIMLELARALEYSWKKEHLFHGDIKPDNVMIRKDGKTKLADFGLAKTIFEEKSEEIMATPMYAPPEVIRAEHKKIGFQSDMYSFGVTLYEALCGTPPFNEADCQKVLYMHLQEYHTPLIEKMPEIDKSLSDLIDKLLSKNLIQRPSSWTEIVEKLQSIQTKKAESIFRFRLIAGISLALTICAIVIAVVLHYNNIEEPTPLVKKLVIKKVKPASQIKVKPKPETIKVTVKEDDKSHLEFKKILERIKNLKGDILAASRLRSQVRILQVNNSLSKIEHSKLIAGIAKINRYIHKIQKDISKKELSSLNLQLKNEKKIAEKTFATIRSKSSLSARQNKIFILASKFLSNKKSKQNIKTLQALFSKAANLDRTLKEYKALVFLLKILPRKYNREAAIFEHLNQITGKMLPWKIKSQEYSISGGSWQTIHLKSQLSKGVFTRKKLRASSISNSQWSLMVDEFLIKGNIRTSKKNIKKTACWLLLNAKDKIFNDFIKKYYPNDLTAWSNCRKLLTSATSEVAAYDAWRDIVIQMTELKPTAYENIKKFKDKYFQTEVYKNSKTALLNYDKIIYTIYPDAFIEQFNIDSLSLKSSNAKIFTIQNRYRFLHSVPSRTRLFLRTLFNKKLNSLAGDRQFVGQFGIFKDVPCGKVYGWMIPSSRMPNISLLRYIPALIDVDNWSYIKKIFQDSKIDLTKLKGNPVQYPFSLYCNGLIALRYGKWKILDNIFSNYNKLLLRDDIDSRLCYSLFADLALKTRGDQYAWEVLNKYKFKETVQSDEIVISLLKVQALLTLNPVDEVAIKELINNIKKRFSGQSDLNVDLEALSLLQKLISAEFKQSSDIKIDIFKKSAYPHLHARLWLEAAARDKILQRNSIKIPSLLKAARSVLISSAFRSALFHKITSLELGYKISSPNQLRASLRKSLLELKPHATNSYPALLTLLFSSELLNGISAKKLAPFAKAFTIKCPSFSPVEEQFPNILYSYNSSKVLTYCEKFSPISFQKIHLWILATAKEKQSGDAEEYILRLKSFRKELRWTEQLLLNKFIQLLENNPASKI